MIYTIQRVKVCVRAAADCILIPVVVKMKEEQLSGLSQERTFYSKSLFLYVTNKTVVTPLLISYCI